MFDAGLLSGFYVRLFFCVSFELSLFRVVEVLHISGLTIPFRHATTPVGADRRSRWRLRRRNVCVVDVGGVIVVICVVV